MPDTGHKKRYVLITGASTGIGRACALHLARIGFAVLAGVRKPADGESLERDAGGGVTGIRIDVADLASIAAAAERVRGIVGDDGLCGLVNNAGIVVAGPVEFVSLEDWRRQFEVNFFGQIAVTQAMLPLLRQHVATHGPGAARIVMMSSIAGKVGQPIVSPYSSSKFSLESMSDGLRIELKPQGIHVCLIEPGAIDTPIWGKGAAHEQGVSPDTSARVLYGAMIDGIMERARHAAETAIPAQRVADAVAACLTRPTPRIRTLVGRDAKMAALARRWLPDRWFDAIVSRAAGVSRTSGATAR